MTNRENLALSLIVNGKTKTWKEYGEEFGMSEFSAQRVYNKIKLDASYVRAILTKIEPLDITPQVAKAIIEPVLIKSTENPTEGTATRTYSTSEEVQSLDDLIDICNIDTTVWDITRYSQKSSNGKYTVEAFMSKKEKEEEVEDLRKSLIEEIKEYHENKRIEGQVIDLQKDLSSVVADETKKKATQLLELAIFDLHLGKLSWKGETGEDYDMDIAIDRYKRCITELLDRVDLSKIDRILLPIGNDMIHIDNKFKTTTNGTPQDTDSRFTKIIKTAKTLMIQVISELSLIAPVDVVVVPGNHDQTVMFTLGEILEAFFYTDENVTIYNDPKLRKYYKYGQNMIMFTHGSDEKHSELGLIAATEMPTMWASTKFREVHLGHLHKSKSVKYTNVDEYQGFKIRIINSLSGTDAWHYSKGYMSLKGAEAFIWDYNKGLITNHFYNL